jgi:hypothetical protein
LFAEVNLFLDGVHNGIGVDANPGEFKGVRYHTPLCVVNKPATDRTPRAPPVDHLEERVGVGLG